MKLFHILTLPALYLSLLIGCTMKPDVSMPEIPSGSPANPQSSTRSRMLAVPSLKEDAITRATSSRLDQEAPDPSEMSMTMDHGNMKMDHGMMNMNMAPDKINHVQTSPAAAVSYTCTMHPEIHEPAPGNCPICGMKLVKEKSPNHAH
jgi:hypothetical protein